jgi:hypothetical protein
MSNQCESKFDGEVSVSCLLELVADVRKGPSAKTLLQAMWLLGCLIAKFATPQSGIAPVGYAAMSEILEDFDIEGLVVEGEVVNSAGDLESVLCAIEAKCAEREVSIQSGPAVGTQGWEVFIPLILELVKMIIENRRKKQQPVPTP